MLTIILLVAFCLDLSQTLTFQLPGELSVTLHSAMVSTLSSPVNEDSSALTVTNFSDTSVRLNWTGAQDLLADSLKVSSCSNCRTVLILLDLDEVQRLS